MWKSWTQIDGELKEYPKETIDKLEDLFGISSILSGSVSALGFHAPKNFQKCITPSGAGKELLSIVEQVVGEQDKDNVAFALLITLAHHELLVDPALSDPEKAWRLIEPLLISGQIKLPYRFGRTLYDKFNDDEGAERLEHLDPQKVDGLLENVEQGIYQVGRYLTGPLGVVRSQEKRYLPTVRRLPLWHCSDTGCRVTHHVDLLVHESAIEEILKALSDILTSQNGPSSEWEPALSHLHRRDIPTRGREYNNLPVLIADAIPPSERSALVVRALTGQQGDFLRRAISEKRPDLAKLSPDALAQRLSDGAQIQSLLLLKDVDLIEIIDSCIWSREIKIPATEVRSSNEDPPELSSYDSNASLSMFGIRTKQPSPAVFLADLVWREYERADQLSELAWRCQKGSATPEHSIVLEYMKLRGARDVVRSLILPSRPISLSVENRLHCNISASEIEEDIVDRILWKCGFDIPRFDSIYNRLSAQLSLLREEVIRYRSRLSEDDRDAIRAKGVNVFVSLEKVIEEIVSYNVWVLSSDHFLDTNFAYRPSDALRRVSETLGAHLEANGQRFTWNANGGNVLGVLLLYARAAANWILGLPGQDRTIWARSLKEIPHFATAGRDARRFGFWHRQLWADADQNELSVFAREFDNLVGQLEKSRLAEVRNGLDHYRDEDRFPTMEIVISCEARVSSAIQSADVNRFIPKLFWMERRERDAFGLSEATLSDSAGRKIVIGRPSPISGIGNVGFSHAIVIPFGNLLGGTNSDLMFTVVEDSAYSRMWLNYPRRAKRLAGDTVNVSK